MDVSRFFEPNFKPGMSPPDGGSQVPAAAADGEPQVAAAAADGANKHTGMSPLDPLIRAPGNQTVVYKTVSRVASIISIMPSPTSAKASDIIERDPRLVKRKLPNEFTIDKTLMTDFFPPEKSATLGPPVAVPAESETPMGSARPLKLHRGTPSNVKARCCWLDTAADIVSAVAMCTNDDDPASICKDKIGVLSKLDMGRLIILCFKDYGGASKAHGTKCFQDIAIEDLRTTFHKYMLVPPQGASTCRLQDIVTAIRTDNYTTDWKLLPDDDCLVMLRCQKIGCGLRKGIADFIATPKNTAAAVLAAAKAKEGVFDITTHCSKCRNRSLAYKSTYVADIQRALTEYCQQECSFEGCNVKHELLITAQHTDPSTKTGTLSDLSSWVPRGLLAFLYELHKLTIPLCWFHHTLEDRAINSNFSAAADALYLHGHTPQAFQQLLKTLSGFERRGEKCISDPRRAAANFLTSEGRPSDHFEKMLLMRHIKIDELQHCAASTCGLPDCDRKCTMDNSHAFELHHTDETTKLVDDKGKRVSPSHLALMGTKTLVRLFPGTKTAEEAIRCEFKKCVLLCANCHMLMTHRNGVARHERV
jgi:hypothetical protein